MVKFVTPVVPLFVPASRPDRFHKADASGADAVILDLEDAVAPTDKEHGRQAVLAHAASFKSPLFVRINAVGTPWHDADAVAVSRLAGAGVMLPKAERAGDVAALVNRVGRALHVVALVESAAGLARLPELLVVPGVVAVAFGSVDFALDLGCGHDRRSLLAARSEIVWRSRAADRAAPIDGVTVDLGGPDIVEDDARDAARMGFGGKMAIHPRQIEPISRAFQPSESERAWAHDILAAAQSGAAMRLGGQMIDRPIVERARRIVSRLPNRSGGTSPE
jgi:citrate lyase subunit beta/citryl-CoA lyase